MEIAVPDSFFRAVLGFAGMYGIQTFKNCHHHVCSGRGVLWNPKLRVPFLEGLGFRV